LCAGFALKLRAERFEVLPRALRKNSGEIRYVPLSLNLLNVFADSRGRKEEKDEERYASWREEAAKGHEMKHEKLTVKL
jgi:hypothetical protein